MGKVIVFILIVLVVFFIFTYKSSDERSDSASQGETSAAGPEPAPPAAQAGESSRRRPAAQAADTSERRLKDLAQKAGVTVQIVERQGKQVRLRVEWLGDSAANGGDYIEMLFRQGVIRDFDENTTGRRWYDQQGRSHWTQDFLLDLR